MVDPHKQVISGPGLAAQVSDAFSITRGRCARCGTVATLIYHTEIDPADLRSPCCSATVRIGMQSS